MSTKTFDKMREALGFPSTALEILIRHEQSSGRCFSQLCRWNTKDGCEKPTESPCPMLAIIAPYNSERGVGIQLRRSWKPQLNAYRVSYNQP